MSVLSFTYQVVSIDDNGQAPMSPVTVVAGTHEGGALDALIVARDKFKLDPGMYVVYPPGVNITGRQIMFEITKDREVETLTFMGEGDWESYKEPVADLGDL